MYMYYYRTTYLTLPDSCTSKEHTKYEVQSTVLGKVQYGKNKISLLTEAGARLKYIPKVRYS